MFSIVAARALLNVERLRPGHLAGGVGGDLVDASLGLPQQLLAAPFERLAPLVDRDRFLKRHLAALEPRDDRFKFLDRALEGELLDVHSGVIVLLGVFGHYLRSRMAGHDPIGSWA